METWAPVKPCRICEVLSWCVPVGAASTDTLYWIEFDQSIFKAVLHCTFIQIFVNTPGHVALQRAVLSCLGINWTHNQQNQLGEGHWVERAQPLHAYLSILSPLQCLTLAYIGEKQWSRTSPMTSSDMTIKKRWKLESE